MDISHLNDSQQAAVLNNSGPLMLLAGAGSGKTRTLVSKIQYLIEEKNYSPYEILAVTFSNKAAKEMRERVSKNIVTDIGALQITTFHAFCAKVLRHEAKYLGLSRNFTIYDTSESKSVVKTILARRGISQKEISVSEVLYYIEALKNTGHYVGAKENSLQDEIDKDELFYDLFLDYESEIHRSNAVDFGGLITGVLNLFDNFEDVLSRYQKRYKYLLVDEYQDTNRCQFRLITLLSEKFGNICVVGDEDQSIYSWRGADIRNILDFETVFPKAQLIKLEQNYRSTKNIIEAATHVISQNIQRKGKSMWTDNIEGDHIDIVECQDDRSEASFVAGKIESLKSDGVDLDDIAVFYRTNAQSRILEDALRQKRLNYRVVAGIKFYERKEIKDMLAYLRVVANSKDSLALSRIINIPVRGIGARTLRKLEDEAIKEDTSLWSTLEKLTEDYSSYTHLRLTAKVKSSLGQFVNLIQEVKAVSVEQNKPSYSYEKLLMDSGYYESLVQEKSHEAQARLENLDELLSAIKQYEEEHQNATLDGFLETIALDQSSEEESSSEISLMTIHGAKGLEYNYVFVTGVEENVFPSYMSLDNGEDGIEEERRLFYVAMTRAMTKLYICFAQGRMLWGSVKFNPPSRFIDEIPTDYYQKYNPSSSTLRKTQNEFDQSQFEDHEKVFVVESIKKSFTFPKGVNVKHKLYGIGKVQSSEGSGGDERVVIIFNDGARKKFLVKFAPIEIIS